MALPLLWLGAAAVSALAVKELADDRKKQHRRRKYSALPEKMSRQKQHDPAVGIYPSDLFSTEAVVQPKVGSIVCCGIGGVLDHTGIWVGDDIIVELDGNGLVKPISTRRFTKERSGKQIFVACDSHENPLHCEQAADRAIAQIYQVFDYHLIDNNCHQFIWQCFAPSGGAVTTFKQLNQQLAKHFDRKIYWDLCATR